MRRAYLFWGMLAALSLLDLCLTILGLAVGGQELNPLPAVAFDHGITAAFLVKAAALGGVFVVVRTLTEGGHARAAEGIMAAWCVVLSLVNAFSFWQLWAAGVIA